MITKMAVRYSYHHSSHCWPGICLLPSENLAVKFATFRRISHRYAIPWLWGPRDIPSYGTIPVTTHFIRQRYGIQRPHPIQFAVYVDDIRLFRNSYHTMKMGWNGIGSLDPIPFPRRTQTIQIEIYYQSFLLSAISIIHFFIIFLSHSQARQLETS